MRHNYVLVKLWNDSELPTYLCSWLNKRTNIFQDRLSIPADQSTVAPPFNFVDKFVVFNKVMQKCKQICGHCT